MKYKSYDDELQLLIDKVEGTNDKDWVELVNDLEANCHPDSLRKSFNVGRYSGYRVAKYYQEKLENEYLADDELDRIQSQRDELYKERVKLQDARREYNKNLRTEARYENLVDVLKERMEDLADLPLENFGEFVNYNEEKCAILQLGDWHTGALVDTQWNVYSINIMKERVVQLSNKVKRYAQNYKITDLMIEINGDMIEGLINCSNRIQAEEDVVQQIIIVSEVLAEMINNLKPYFNSISITTTLGNHGRLVPDKKASIGKENMEMLIPEFLRLRLSKDVKILTSQGLDFMKYEFDGKIICLAHGQNDKINTVIEDFVKVYKLAPSEIHLAHTHAYKDINKSNIMVTVCGSLKGSDEYALGMREVTKSSQNLIIYGEDRGIFELILD